VDYHKDGYPSKIVTEKGVCTRAWMKLLAAEDHPLTEANSAEQSFAIGFRSNADIVAFVRVSFRRSRATFASI